MSAVVAGILLVLGVAFVSACKLLYQAAGVITTLRGERDNLTAELEAEKQALYSARFELTQVSEALERALLRENQWLAELEAEKQRARRRSRRNGQPGTLGRGPVVAPARPHYFTGAEIAGLVDMRDATAATDEPKVAGPSPAVLKAIRQAAGGDRPLARHLHAYAQEALDTGTSEREVIRMIQQGEQVAL